MQISLTHKNGDLDWQAIGELTEARARKNYEAGFGRFDEELHRAIPGVLDMAMTQRDVIRYEQRRAEMTEDERRIDDLYTQVEVEMHRTPFDPHRIAAARKRVADAIAEIQSRPSPFERAIEQAFPGRAA